MTKTQTHIGAITLVIIPSADQDRSIDFYVDSLGFEKRTDVPFGGELPLGRGVPAGGHHRHRARAAAPG